MKVELYYDSKRFIFRLPSGEVGYAPFATLELQLHGPPNVPELIDEMKWLMTDYMPGEVLNKPGVKGVVLGPLRPFTHEVSLHGCGNPDRQQYADIAPKKTVRVCGVEEAAKAAIAYQSNYDMGGGNCAKDHGKVRLLPQSAGGKRKLVGYVSYGGRYETVAERKAFEKMMKEKYKTKQSA
jgi:hypothetical protein